MYYFYIHILIYRVGNTIRKKNKTRNWKQFENYYYFQVTKLDT